MMSVTRPPFLPAAAFLLLVLAAAFWLLPRKSPTPPIVEEEERTPPAVAHAVPEIAPTSTQVSPDRAAALERLRSLLGARDARRNEALLTFRDEDAYRRFLARASAAGLNVLGQLDGLLTVRVGYDSLSALQSDLLGNPGDYSEVNANYLVHIPRAPSAEERTAGHYVPVRDKLLAALGVTSDNAEWGRGVTVAILDSGVAADSTFGDYRVRHLDIGLGLAAGGGGSDGHGTAVAALAAGGASDAPGIAPSAQLLSIRVTDTSGTGDIFGLSQAIMAAADAGARVINVSLGGYSTTSLLNNAITYATNLGAVIVAAAGNDQAAQLTWPAADPRVVSVGAVDAVEQQVIFSNSGPQLQMTAPGYGVQTAWLNNERVYFNGTSASAPIVSGAIAAVMSQSGVTATQAWQILQQTASDGGPAGADPDYGHGILNLGWAMNRQNSARVDTAVSSHHYNTATGQMEIVVQNRSAQHATNLELVIATGGDSRRAAIPTLAPGAVTVVSVPVDVAQLAQEGGVTIQTQLNNAPGIVDHMPANNRRSSTIGTAK